MISNVNETHISFKQINAQNEVVDNFTLVKTHNIGVLEPIPILNKNRQEDSHQNFLIIFLVLSLVTFLGLIIWFCRRRIMILKGRSLINYEMQNL